MKYIMKNIRLFYKYEKNIFFLCISSVFFSMISILVAYGIYSNYMVQKIKSETDLNWVMIDIIASEEDPLTKERFDQVLLDCPEELFEQVDMIYTDVEIETEQSLQVRFCVRDGKITGCSLFKENMKKNSLASDYFTEEQEEQGECVALVYTEETSAVSDAENVDSIQLQGKEYRVIGTQRWAPPALVPYLSLDDATPLSPARGITLYFHTAVSAKEYAELKECLEEPLKRWIRFPERNVDLSRLYLYNSVLCVLIFIIVISAVDFALFYKYVLVKRRKHMVVFRICGFTKQRAIRMYLGECLILVAAMIPCAMVLFRYGICPVLQKIYEGFESYYSWKTYLFFGCTYFGGSMLILLGMIAVEMKQSFLVQNSAEEESL